ncbi:hypothetical protein ACWEV4_11460 [Streptomyces sp. NPDC003860]
MWYVSWPGWWRVIAFWSSAAVSTDRCDSTTTSGRSASASATRSSTRSTVRPTRCVEVTSQPTAATRVSKVSSVTAQP